MAEGKASCSGGEHVRGKTRLSPRRRRGAPSKPSRGAAWRRRVAAAMGRGKGQRGMQERHSWPAVAAASCSAMAEADEQSEGREKREKERERERGLTKIFSKFSTETRKTLNTKVVHHLKPYHFGFRQNFI